MHGRPGINQRFLSAIATWKVIIELLRGRQGRLCEEYNFAKEFFEDLRSNPQLHPFLKQKGYQAIAGDPSFTASEIEYLLTLQDSSRALRDYVFGRKYLEHLSTAGNAQILFKKRYSKAWVVRVLEIYYFLQYFFLYLLAFSLLFFHSIATFLNTRTLLALAVSCAIFLPAALYSLVAGLRIGRAKTLVTAQKIYARTAHPNGVF